jgi:hypothetical protein
MRPAVLMGAVYAVLVLPQMELDIPKLRVSE